MKNKEEVVYSRALVPTSSAIYKFIVGILITVILALLVGYYAFIKPALVKASANSNADDLAQTAGVDDVDSSYSSEIEKVLQEINYDEQASDERKLGTVQMNIDYVDNLSISINYPEIGVEEIDNSILGYATKLKNEFVSAYKDANSLDEYSQYIDYSDSLSSGDQMLLTFTNTIIKNDDELISKTSYAHTYSLITGAEVGNTEVTNHDVEESGANEFVSLESEEAPFEVLFSGDIIEYAASTINVRASKNTNSAKLVTLNAGDAIEVKEISGDWDTVIYNGQVAYVKSGYLSRKKNLHRAIELEVVDRGIDPSKPMVAVTYDDGPNPVSTPRILDTLEKYNVVATFFDLGQLVNKYPYVTQREEKIGCEVGNHSYSHPNFNILTDEQIQDEITKSRAAFVAALGHDVTLFRPPYGNANLKVKENLDYPIIKWNVDSLDWKSRNCNKILTQIKATKNFDGHIILMHSIYGTTADATEKLIPWLIDQGYQLVTVSELAFYKGYTTIYTAQDYTNFN